MQPARRQSGFGSGLRRNGQFKKAALAGLAEAQYALAQSIELGYAAKASTVNAIPWYRRAAHQRHRDAQYELGRIFLHGAEGVAKNEQEAVAFLRQAAEKNVHLAQFELAECFARGVGGLFNTKQAAFWYRRAAESGHPQAEHMWAACVVRGNGD